MSFLVPSRIWSGRLNGVGSPVRSFAPSKNIFGLRVDTFYFNIIIVLLSTIPLYFALYYEVLARFVKFIEKFRIRREFFNALGICFFIFL